jgi:hypothetical protein
VILERDRKSDGVPLIVEELTKQIEKRGLIHYLPFSSFDMRQV